MTKSRLLSAAIFAAAVSFFVCNSALAGTNKSKADAGEQITKKLIVNKNKDQNIWTISSLKIMTQLPKKKATPQQLEARKNSNAWLLVRLDRKSGATDVSVRWREYVHSPNAAASTNSTFNNSRFKLPGYEEQAGPNIKAVRATDCADGYQESDVYTTDTYYRGCNEYWNYALPVTMDVLRFLAQRAQTDPDAPMAITFKGASADGKLVTSVFHFYPAEAKAVIAEFEKLQTFARIGNGIP